MIIQDKKAAITAILKKRKPSGEVVSEAPMKMESVSDEDGESDGRFEAAQDMLAAIHEKSADKLMQAMANFMDLRSMAPESEESEE